MMLQRRQVFAVSLGTALTLLMLVVAALGGGSAKRAPEETLARREVKMYVPPAPPPPPQAITRAGGDGGRPLAMVSAPSAVKLEVMELNVSMPGAAPGTGGSGSEGLGSGIGFGDGGTGNGLVADVGAVDLAALDGHPTVVNAPFFQFPGSVTRQGVNEFSVHFQIIIDEEGFTYPVRIVANPYPELNDELLDYASRVRFTPPTQSGVKVKAQFLWPVVFSAER